MTTPKIADVLERSLWTLLEGASAAGLVAGYQALDGLPDIPGSWVAVVVIVLGAILAAIKSALAQKFGNGTAATLPLTLEPIPADAVQGDLPPQNTPAAI